MNGGSSAGGSIGTHAATGGHGALIHMTVRSLQTVPVEHNMEAQAEIMNHEAVKAKYLQFLLI